MEEIYNRIEKGTILLITFIVLGILLLLGSYFLNFTLVESRISKSQQAGAQAYYLAEAGINETIWKLKNNDTWKTNFETDPAWSDSLFKEFLDGSRYDVTIHNSAYGRGRIVSIATIPLPKGKTARRVVKVTVFKALANPLEKVALFAGGKELKIKRSKVRIYNGNIFSNGKLVIENFSNVEVHSPGDNALFAGCAGKKDKLEIKKSEVKVYGGNIFSKGDLKIEKDSTVEINNGSGNALFAGCDEKGKELKIKDSDVIINGANIFSNEKIKIEGSSSDVKVYDDPDTKDDPETDIRENLEGKVLAVDKLEFKHGAGLNNLTVEAVCTGTTGQCDPDCLTDECPPEKVEDLPTGQFVPAVDFESDYPECTSLNSFKCRAKAAEDLVQCEVKGYDSTDTQVFSDSRCVFSEANFKTLLWDVGEGGKLVLNNEITYVDKNVELKGGRHLIVNGALVAKDIKIGNRWEWKEHHEPPQSGYSSVTVCEADQADYITDCTHYCQNHPCGLLAKKRIEFGKSFFLLHDIDITGVLYALDEIKVTSILQNLDIKGAIIGGKVKIESTWYTWFDVTYDKDIICYGLGYTIDECSPVDPTFSPIINIEHWEESY